LKGLGIVLFLIILLVSVELVYASLSPKYLKSGRTYDQETDYIQWNGNVSLHKPISQGHHHKATFGRRRQLYQWLYRTGHPDQGWGISFRNFTYLKTFSVQVAYSGSSSVGTAVIKACGKTVLTQDLYLDGSSVPGFNNFPTPAWNVPTSGDCSWSISATGGYVDFRAVTTTFRSTSAPIVDLKVNNSNGPLDLAEPASYTLSLDEYQCG